jgi:hypothetical protein
LSGSASSPGQLSVNPGSVTSAACGGQSSTKTGT